MNTLILTVSAGGGHFVTARAISEIISIEEPGSEIQISDAIKYISPVLDKVLIGTYLNSLKINPKAYDLFYSAFNKVGESDSGSNRFVEKMEELAATRLLPLIKKQQPEIILSTHPFTTQLMASLKRNGHTDIPCLAIITDYGIHSATVHEGMDAFVIAHESLIPEMVRRGIPSEDVLPAGIPVRSSCGGHFNREKTLASLELDPDLPTVTLAGGSLGLGKMERILEELDAIPRKFNIIVISSNNQKLQDEALKIAGESDKNIVPLKFCNFMDALLYSTDLLVTKPGGLTISEALVTGVPMAIFTAVGGQEKQNRNFLVSNGLAIDIGNGKNSSDAIEELLFDKKKLQEIADRSKDFARPHAALGIYAHMKKLIMEYQADPYLVKSPPEIDLDQEVLDESTLEKIMGFTDDFMDDLATVPVVGSVMEKVRSYYQKNDSEYYYELSDEEVKEILSSSQSHKKTLKNRPKKRFPGKLILSGRTSKKFKREKEDTGFHR